MIPTTSAASIPSRSVTISASNMERPRKSAAFRAVPPDLMRVVRHSELLPPADILLEPFDLAALELQDPAAPEADHVIVVVPPEHRLVPRLAVPHLDLVH